MSEENQQKEAVARFRRARTSPKKARKVVDMIRDLEVEEAQAQLALSPRRAARHVEKVLNSAIANAEHNHSMSPSKLEISEIKVDEGPIFKRWMPRARGQADEIHKKTSHITVKLKEKEETEPGKEYMIPDSKGSSKPSSDKGGGGDQEGPVERKKISPDKSRDADVTDQIFQRKSGME